MRRLYLSLVLPLFMLFVQQGAVWHEIGHLSQRSAPQDQQHRQKQDATGKLCERCLAFANLAASVTPGNPSLRLASVSHVLASSDAIVSAPAQAPAARSRGPPHLL